jgi:alpha-beta hydrolase superfamily lysophospholipase
MSAPGPAEPTETFRFSSADGCSLYGEYFACDSPRAAALILHGFFEHCGRYREVANVLNQTGFTTLAFDYRGHGRAAGQRGHVQRFEEYLDDFDAALAELGRRDGGTLPVMLLSHSHGALISLRLLTDVERCPERIRAAVLSSPFLGLKLDVAPAVKLLARLAGHFVPHLTLQRRVTPEQLTSDPAKQEERRLDTLCHEVTSARWYTEVLGTWERVSAFANRVKVPTLWLVAGNDQVVDVGASRDIQARLRAPSRYCEFENFKHEVFNERERERAFTLLRDFAVEQFPVP